MINITDKADCVGCNACLQRCPVSCITMHEDEQGFLYPKVDIEECLNCGLCERVCPVINQGEPRVPESVFAARNGDSEIVRRSSSGGIFYALARSVIEAGGVVFGARFDDDWQVVHGWTETIEGLGQFQGSKYVQSKIGGSYKKAESFLKQGRPVMFTGTPCQIKGLTLFLQRDYGPLLLKVEVVCHGVPSPKVWRQYLKHIVLSDGAKGSQTSVSETPLIESISFRDKRRGWANYGFNIRFAPANNQRNSEFYEPMARNLYMMTFLNNLDLRPSCYQCPAKCGKSCANITLADFWGIARVNPGFYSREGVSLILSYDSSATRRLNNCDIESVHADYADALRYNPSIEKDPKKSPAVELFWNDFHQNGISALEIAKKINRQGLSRRILNKIKSIIRSLMRMATSPLKNISVR